MYNMQAYREHRAFDSQKPKEKGHPDPGGQKLAAHVLINAYKTLYENDPREVLESAKFFSNASPSSMFYWWMSVLLGEDPGGSNRLAVLKRIGKEAIAACHYANAKLKEIDPRGEASDNRTAWIGAFREKVRPCVDLNLTVR